MNGLETALMALMIGASGYLALMGLLVRTVALYARVSKGEDQNVDNQLLILRQWAADRGNGDHEIKEFVDIASTRDTRPQKEEVLRLARFGNVDTIAFVSLDRWGRNMGELVSDIEELRDRGVVVVSVKEGLRFDNAIGMLQAHILAAFAAFERARIRERTLWGLARARAQGKRLGRPPKKSPPVNPPGLSPLAAE